MPVTGREMYTPTALARWGRATHIQMGEGAQSLTSIRMERELQIDETRSPMVRESPTAMDWLRAACKERQNGRQLNTWSALSVHSHKPSTSPEEQPRGIFLQQPPRRRQVKPAGRCHLKGRQRLRRAFFVSYRTKLLQD